MAITYWHKNSICAKLLKVRSIFSTSFTQIPGPVKECMCVFVCVCAFVFVCLKVSTSAVEQEPTVAGQCHTKIMGYWKVNAHLPSAH